MRLMGLPGESIPVIVEPLELPAPAREPAPDKRRPVPAQPVPKPREPVPAGVGEP
jgi:hypothetical protein